MSEENKVNVEEEKQPQVKQTTVRYFDDDLTFIAQESRELGIPQYEVVKHFRRAYERLKTTTTGSQQEKLKDVVNYADAIVNLFKSVADSCDELVKEEQTNAIEAEQRYNSLIVKHNEFEKTAKANEEDFLKKIKSLENEIKNYQDTKKSVDALESAHFKELAVKDKEIAELNNKLEDYNAVQAEMLTLKDEITRLEDAAADLVIQKQKDELALRQEMQSAQQEKIEKIYSKQTELIETARKETESRMREEFKNETERIRQEYQAEIERIRSEHTSEIQRIRKEHTSEVERIRKERQDDIKRIREEHKQEISELRTALASSDKTKEDQQ